MKWLLFIFFAYGDLEPTSIPFETRAECEAAGEAFVEANPNFEWVDSSRERELFIQLVMRPTAECLPVEDDE